MLRNSYKMLANANITVNKIPNGSGCYPFAKSHQIHQGSQSEQLRTLVTFQGGTSDSSNRAVHMCFDSRMRHNAFRWPGLRIFRLPSYSIVASQ